ncbi:phage major tail tube protein [uncultured Alistipes sp.]|uniref:phage major tail tube protein n=1 Tax=uncultured Alistipes sp. TaxID=538949 RepID=UPI0025917A92|nr:phage major tail tube protein [uncultured Alistipes sp.]
MTITKVYDANVYVNNASTHGQASEITAPAINAVMADYKAMGMVGSMELFNGFDKMETMIKWTYPNNEVQKACANFLKPVDLMIRSSKAEYDNGGISGEKPIVMYVRGYPKTHPGGSFKAKEDTELENTFAVNYYKLEIDGDAIVEIDVMNNIYKVGGTDLLADRRQNLGL